MLLQVELRQLLYNWNGTTGQQRPKLDVQSLLLFWRYRGGNCEWSKFQKSLTSLPGFEISSTGSSRSILAQVRSSSLKVCCSNMEVNNQCKKSSLGAIGLFCWTLGSFCASQGVTHILGIQSDFTNNSHFNLHEISNAVVLDGVCSCQISLY